MNKTYKYTLEWIHERRTSPNDSAVANASPSRASRGANAQAVGDIIMCLPASFDLPRDGLIEQFSLLASQVNTSNAKYVSDAMLNISQALPDATFLGIYLDLVRSERFGKLGESIE
jgi:hypothetical protein